MESTHLIFGIHAVLEALALGKKIEKIMLKKGIDGINIDKIVQLCREQHIPVQYVPMEKLDRTVAGRHQGVVAYMAQIAYISLEEGVEAALAANPHPMVLLLDGVTDVRNLGAVARTAECAGVSLIILPAKGGAALNADAVKSSAGALLRVPVSRVPNLRMALYYLKESGFSLISTAEKAPVSIFDTDMRGPAAIVLGAEDTGISPPVLALCDHQTFIPMQGKISSLNVSAAAAAVLFEAVRQRISRPLLVLCCLLAGWFGNEASAQQKALPRIGIAGIAIENSTFHPLVNHSLRISEGQEIMHSARFLHPDSTMGKAAVWLPALRASGGSGLVSREAYETAVNKAIETIKENMPYDAFWFYIHGACSVQGLDDPEGDFLERIRGVIGNDALVSTTMDLHGNVSWRIAVYSDLITTYRTAPHDDAYISTRRGVVNLLDRLSSGKGRPAYKAWVAVPILLPGELTSTRVEPAKSLYALVPEVEAFPGVLDAGIWIGYAWADERRNHGVVMVVGDDKEQVGRGAKMLAQKFWDVRHQFDFEAPTYSLDECLDIALASNKKPFFISDMGDNPSGGGSGQVTWTLARLLRRPEFQTANGKNLIYASIPGPEMIAAAQKAGVGNRVEAMVGAMVDNIHEGPVLLSGTVMFTGADRAVIKAGSIQVIVTMTSQSFQQEQQMTNIGLNPREADIVMVKQGYLVPTWYNMQADWVMAHTRGGVDQDLLHLPYKRIIRPMFPLDPDMPDPELNLVFFPSAKHLYGR